MQQTALVIFAFNRPDHLEKTLQHLTRAHVSADLPLYFFVDGARHEAEKSKVAEVISLINAYKHKDKRIRIQEKNQGLRNSVLAGMNAVFNESIQAIVLEDDICIHPDTLDFHLRCLSDFKDNNKIGSISAYVIPAIGTAVYKRSGSDLFSAQRASSWAWSTWKDRWEAADWDKQNLAKHYLSNALSYHRTGGDKVRMLHRELLGQSSSWAILWDYNHFKNQMHCIYPTSSFAMNLGLDNSGTHSKPSREYSVDLNDHHEIKNFKLSEEHRSYIDFLFRKLARKMYRYPLDLINYLKVYLKYGR